MFKFLSLLISLFLVGVSFAQEATEVVIPATQAPTPPWAGNAVVTLIVTSILGILGMFANKIPGKFGEAVRWLLDLISANPKHDK